MSFRSLPILSFALLAAFATACRDSGDGDDDGVDPDGGGDGDMTIQMVQNDATPAATPVTLRGVVVTAIDNYGPRKGNFYVAEPEAEASPFSGVLVFGAPLDQVSAIAVGDLVDITGAQKDEFSLDTDDSTVTELIPIDGGEMTVAKTGTGVVPAPHVINALAVGQMAAAPREAEYEKWEGVLVTVTNVTVTSDLSPISSSAPDPMFVGFDITGVLEVDSSLSEIPYVADPPRFVNGGDCLASVTGMGDYFFNYKVLPRATADIVLLGAGCPAAEAIGMCTDGIDNDANGFTDCMDRGCGSEPTCTTDTTVVMIQTGAVTGGVMLDDVVVVAVDTIGSTQGVWVSDAAQAAANQGIFVFTGNTAPAVAIGALVDVMGNTAEFDVNPVAGDTLTEVVQATVTPATGTATPLPLAGVAIPALASITATGEPYESVLVTLSNLRVMAEVAPGDRVQLTNGTDTIVMDDDIFNYAAGAYPAGTCFSVATGIMTVNLFDDERRFLPRAATDLTTVTCP